MDMVNESADPHGGQGKMEEVEVVEVEIEDLEVHGRHGTKPRRAKTYRIVIDGEDLKVHTHVITGAGILDLVRKSPNDWKLEAELHGGATQLIQPDDQVVLHQRGIVRFITEQRHHHHRHRETIQLTIVVNGQPAEMSVSVETLLSVLVARALEETKNVGRPAEDWELRNEAGQLLNQVETVAAYGLVDGATLFLSLKAGAAGDGAHAEILVDPAVSHAKFERELSDYRAVEDAMIRRGQWLIKAEFPEVFVVFGTPKCPLPIVAFGAVLDFTNYDLWPPSVRIVNPFTRVPYKHAELPLQAHLNRLVSVPLASGQPVQVQVQPMMQSHSLDEVPFLCLPGVREYHWHPAHTGDDWLLRRDQGDGKLFHILEVLYRYGVDPVSNLNVQIIPQMNVPL